MGELESQFPWSVLALIKNRPNWVNMKICNWVHCSAQLTGKRLKFCSIECKNKYHTVLKRKKNKEDLIKHHGSKCVDCGYEGPPFMFDFDHRDPSQKSFGLARKGHTKSYNLLVLESEKCDLVCANCHRFRTHKQRCLGCEYC